jgi:hypothetical protein
MTAAENQARTFDSDARRILAQDDSPSGMTGR